MNWNDTNETWPEHLLIHELFEIQAKKTPDQVALVFGDTKLTYAELDAKAQSLADHLTVLGAGPESVVGLCLMRTERIVIGILGILKSGAAYLPLEQSYPDERLAFMLNDSDAKILVTERETAHRINGFKGARIRMDRMGPVETHAKLLSETKVTPNNLAYILYTSGSTGTPKGVAVEHRSVTNMLFSMSRRLEITENEVVLSVAPYGFDVALPDWFWALMFGGKLVLVEAPVIHDPNLMLAIVHKIQPTHLQAPPTFWEMMTAKEASWSPDIRVVSTGEHISDALRDKLRSRCRVVWNLYGPTETTVWSCACNITEDTQSNSIGVPIGNTTLYIQKEDGEPADIGQTGELLIGGVGLARGYVNREELTEASFCKVAPFGDQRLYRTGDLVRRRQDGTLEYLGRKDHQIKIRGFRVELGEIDAAIQRHPDILSAVSVVREDHTGVNQLYTYVVRKPESNTEFWQYRDFLEKTLPLHMLPTGIEILERMPLNANGKVDRAALPKPSNSRRELNSRFTEAANDLEVKLTCIWEEVLEVENLGVNDNFFDLGGHSISATRIINRVTREIGILATVTMVFGAPTIRLFSKLLAEKQGEE
ncbi:MAG: amino acid adenylation domain-containing protein [Verrucomicrobiae bacterium]|nr:amino acid adenylation domain-containing protein [Verrucomicrobiae bacterium]